MVESEKSKWVTVVTRLIQLTQDGILRWTSESPPHYFYRSAEDYVETVFRADYQQRKLRLYKRIYSVDIDPLTAFQMGLQNIGVDKPKVIWRNQIILEFTDREGNSLWQFPDIAPILDLLRAVRYQVAGVDQFVDDILRNSKEVKDS